MIKAVWARFILNFECQKYLCNEEGPSIIGQDEIVPQFLLCLCLLISGLLSVFSVNDASFILFH